MIVQRRDIDRRPVHHHSMNISSMRSRQQLTETLRLPASPDRTPVKRPIPELPHRPRNAPTSLSRVLPSPRGLLDSGELASPEPKSAASDESHRGSLSASQPLTAIPSVIDPDLKISDSDHSDHAAPKPVRSNARKVKSDNIAVDRKKPKSKSPPPQANKPSSSSSSDSDKPEDNPPPQAKKPSSSSSSDSDKHEDNPPPQAKKPSSSSDSKSDAPSVSESSSSSKQSSSSSSSTEPETESESSSASSSSTSN